MHPRTRVFPLALLVAASGCAGGGNHTPAPGASGTGLKGSGGAPTTVIVGPVGSCSAGAAAMPAPAEADPLCTPGMPAVSYQRDVAPLVRCTGEACHVPWSYATLVGQQSRACCDQRLIVDPGHPSESHLVQAVSDTDSCVGRMGELDAPQIATIVAWICEGAPND